jgi:transcriptional regulator with XRE-family HTH domain
MNSQQKIGKNLRNARLKAKFTQKELAEKAGVHVNYYARLERGEENPSLETLKKLTKILKIKSSDILSF